MDEMRNVNAGEASSDDEDDDRVRLIVHAIA